MVRWKTDEEIIEAVKNSISQSNALQLLQTRKAGGYYKLLRERIVKLNLDISHWCKSPKQSIETNITDRSIKTNYLNSGVEYKCSICELVNWLDKPLSLQLDHIDGNHYNNKYENLRLLCPNCHSQTETFCGRNLASPQNYCDCGKAIFPKSKMCRDCADATRRKNTKIIWPDKNLLQDMVTKSSYLAVGKLLGVSDNAVRKHLVS